MLVFGLLLMPAPKKIRQRHAPGQLSVQQTHDTATVGWMLQQAGLAPPDIIDDARCFLMGYLGDEPVGIAVLESQVDAALMCALFVLEPIRRRGVGTALISAARIAARTRGARLLYAIAPSSIADYLCRFGFRATGSAELTGLFSGAAPRLRERPGGSSHCCVFCLDISRDGLIER